MVEAGYLQINGRMGVTLEDNIDLYKNIFLWCDRSSVTAPKLYTEAG